MTNNKFIKTLAWFNKIILCIVLFLILSYVLLFWNNFYFLHLSSNTLFFTIILIMILRNKNIQNSSRIWCEGWLSQHNFEQIISLTLLECHGLTNANIKQVRISLERILNENRFLYSWSYWIYIPVLLRRQILN